MEKLPEFSLKDKSGWEDGLAKNKDPYGGAVYQYAAKWASLMERDINAGKPLADIAKPTSHEADKDMGITGFMYGCAVSILSHVWTYGEELRRWHNLDTQIGNEGEKANERGGVLNPALMSISAK